MCVFMHICFSFIFFFQQERYQEKKEKELKQKLAAREKSKAQSDKQLKLRLRKAEASGAMAALMKLEHTLKSRCMRTQDLFNEMDADKNGDLDIDEFMEVLSLCYLLLKARVSPLYCLLHRGYLRMGR